MIVFVSGRDKRVSAVVIEDLGGFAREVIDPVARLSLAVPGGAILHARGATRLSFEGELLDRISHAPKVRLLPGQFRHCSGKRGLPVSKQVFVTHEYDVRVLDFEVRVDVLSPVDGRSEGLPGGELPLYEGGDAVAGVGLFREA